MMARIISVLLIVTLAVLETFSDVMISHVSKTVEKAVLEEDWAKVAELINEVTPESPTPLRLIMGHACLALNRNNESIALFIGAATSEDLSTWQTYAQDFKERNPKKEIADYFVGDSLAREGKYEKAISAFNVGLDENPKHVLLLNAKGVCLAKIEKLTDAKKCFDSIATSKINLADAYANIGWQWIQQSDAAEGAATAFKKAIGISEAFSMAAHGLMCIRLVQGQQEEAAELYYLVESSSDLHHYKEIETNISSYALVAMNNNEAQHTNEEILGTFLQKSFGDQSPGDLAGWISNRINAQEKFEGSRAPQFVKDWGRKLMQGDISVHGRDYARDYGQDSLAREFNKLSIDDQYTTRKAMLDTSERVERVSKMATWDGRLNSLAGSISGNIPGKVAGTLVGGVVNDSASVYKSDAAFYRSAAPNIPHFEMSTPKGYFEHGGTVTIPGQRQPADGGARLTFENVTFDDGNWPFKPLYGLAYGILDEKVDHQTVSISNKESAKDDNK